MTSKAAKSIEQVTPWFALRCATRQEKRAVEALEEAFAGVEGFEAYLPVYVRWERLGHMKTRTKKHRPLLPGYLFAMIPNGDFCTAERADGVSSVLRYTNAAGELRPRGISSVLIHELRMIEASGEFDEAEPGSATSSLKIGQRVRVSGGQFTGLSGILMKLKGNKRASVLIEMFGRSSPAELPIAQLDAA
jgi:transcription antitermination factor NusG